MIDFIYFIHQINMRCVAKTLIAKKLPEELAIRFFACKWTNQINFMSTIRVRIIQMSAHFVYTQKFANGLPSEEN